MTSWKKIYALSNGKWDFDSPTFDVDRHNAHRHEYSYYQVRQLLLVSGFQIVDERATNVYFDDPQGLSTAFQLAALCAAKALSGEWRSAAKLFLRRGAVAFFLAKKVKEAPSLKQADLMSI